MINKEHELSLTKYSITKKNDFKRRFASTNTRQGKLNQKIKKTEKSYILSKILDKFEKLKRKVK